MINFSKEYTYIYPLIKEVSTSCLLAKPLIKANLSATGTVVVPKEGGILDTHTIHA
jgi:hypothetical protein